MVRVRRVTGMILCMGNSSMLTRGADTRMARGCQWRMALACRRSRRAVLR